MKMSAKFMCPYCGKENKAVVDASSYPRHEVVYCDGIEGGCDKRIVITHKAVVEVKTSEIAGE